MARLATLGSELNSTAAGMEWSGISGGSISTTNARSGTYCYRVSGLSSGTSQRARFGFVTTNANGPYFVRAYFYFATLPSAENRIMYLSNSTTVDAGVAVYITIDNNGLLRLYDNVGQIGSASSALSTGTHYRIEFKMDRTPASGSQVVEGLVDGVIFATSSTRTIGNTVSQLFVGGNLHLEAQTTGAWSIDDIAVNDSTGSYQTSYPGSGKVICLRPNAAGDANSFATQVGGTAGSSNNYTRVNEVTPDDATSYNGSTTLSQEDLFNVTDSGIGGTDRVNCVAIGYRYANITSADATASFKVEVIKASGGTKAQSTAVIPNSTTWRTYVAGGAPTANTPFMNYLDPDGDYWQKSSLDTMQIGYILSAANTQTVAISNVYAMVDYTPDASTDKSTTNFFAFF